MKSGSVNVTCVWGYNADGGRGDGARLGVWLGFWLAPSAREGRSLFAASSSCPGSWSMALGCTGWGVDEGWGGVVALKGSVEGVRVAIVMVWGDSERESECKSEAEKGKGGFL